MTRSTGGRAAALAVLLLLEATATSSQGTSLPCVSYGGSCLSGSQTCCYSPLVMCLANTREQMACLSPLDTNNLSPTFMSSPLFGTLSAGLTNATMQFISLLPNMVSQLTSALAPPAG